MKAYNPQPDAFDICQALIIGHFAGVADDGPLEFHAIALWNSFWYNPWDLITLVKWDPDNQLDPGTTTNEQLGMTRILIQQPDLISASCTYCRDSIAHPWKLVWNIGRGPRGQEVHPACPYDPAYWPPLWTPDYWPPVYL